MGAILGVGEGLGVEDGVTVGVDVGVGVGEEQGLAEIRKSHGASARWVSRTSSIKPVNCSPTLPEMVHMRSGSGSFGWRSKVLNVFTPST